ncbi:MAG TPA: PIG-L family deacetylase [Ardenticatenaceae bacterium]|jgi:LmbE family N-acetylglucosaminyl deacetylase
MDTLVILSPHFDDAVLSCGGQIWETRRQGGIVHVLTLFAGPPLGEPPPFAQVQHAMWGSPPDPNRLRRAEDVAALTRLGCYNFHHLDAPDAVYRLGTAGQVLYDTEEAIFGEVHPDEATYAVTLADMVRAYLPMQATILAPLGAGHHVDHLLSHAVGLSLLNEGREVAFYEELPYIESPGALEAALAEKLNWQMEATPISEEALQAKLAAMAYYQTQIPVLYRTEEEMQRRVRAIAQGAVGGEGYAERVWRRSNE